MDERIINPIDTYSLHVLRPQPFQEHANELGHYPL